MDCEDKNVLSAMNDYVSSAPKFSLKEGTYDFLIDQEKNFQDKYNWGDSEEIWDDTEQLPEEIDEPDEMEEQLDIEKQCE